MADSKCPFQLPVINGSFGCRLAQPVTVRNAPQIQCRSDTALERCRLVYDRLKSAGLAAFGVADDPGTTPHSTYLKIQCGGLLGLQAGVAPGNAVTDIDALLETVTEGGARIDDLPYSELTQSMLTYKPPRRRDRRR
jgi:hypothetical protein